MFQRGNMKVRLLFFSGWNREIGAKLVNQTKNPQMARWDLVGMPWGKANSISFCSITVRTQKLGGIKNWLKPVIAIQWRKPFIMKMAALPTFQIARRGDTDKGRNRGAAMNQRRTTHFLIGESALAWSSSCTLDFWPNNRNVGVSLRL